MSKIGKLFSALQLIARQPALLNHVLDDNEVWKKYVVRNYNLPDGLPMVQLHDLFPGFEVEIPVFAFLDGGSLPTDIALLMQFAENIPDCNYFEIGTWRGESVVNVAQKAKHCTTLNLSDDEMRQIGMSEEYIALTAFFSKGIKNITHLRGNSKTYDFAGLNQKYDLIFIDGDHHYDMVKNDTARVFEYLVHEKSIVVWHDYAKNPESVRFEVLAGILDGIPQQYRKYLYHAGNTMSAYFSTEPQQTTKLKYPVVPKNYFKITIRNKFHL
jgi:predicted O-methyltransferase YrrM